jgi:hypothetical protein
VAKKWILYVGVVLQLGIVAGMLVKMAWPVWTGTPVYFEVLPHDPRNFFRGDYLELRYDFNSLDLSLIPNDLANKRTFRYGDVVFVGLTRKPSGLCSVSSVSEKQPPVPFIRALVERECIVGTDKILELRAGVEDYFANKKRLRVMQKRLRELDVSVPRVRVGVFLAKDGTARIGDIDWNTVSAKLLLEETVDGAQ